MRHEGTHGVHTVGVGFAKVRTASEEGYYIYISQLLYFLIHQPSLCSFSSKPLQLQVPLQACDCGYGCDCDSGIHVLHYIKTLFKQPDPHQFLIKILVSPSSYYFPLHSILISILCLLTDIIFSFTYKTFVFSLNRTIRSPMKRAKNGVRTSCVMSANGFPKY